MASGHLTSDAEAMAAFDDFLSEGEEILNDPSSLNQQTQETAPNPPEPNEEELPEGEEEEIPQAASEGDEPAEGEGEEVAEPESISTLDGLASYFGVEHDDVLQSIEVEAPDGSQVPIADALQSWRETTAGVDAYRTELQDKFQEARSEVDAQLASQSRNLMLIADTMIKELQSNYSEEKLEILAAEDPHAYTDAFKRRYEIGELITKAINGVGEVATQTEGHSKEQVQRMLAEENQKLLSKKPDWVDQGKRAKALESGIEYLTQTGFSMEEISGLTDHRLLLVVDDARRFRELQKGTDSRRVDELRKKGLRPPSPGMRPQQSAGNRGQAPGNSKAENAIRARFKKSGDPRDAVALIQQHL